MPPRERATNYKKSRLCGLLPNLLGQCMGEYNSMLIFPRRRNEGKTIERRVERSVCSAPSCLCVVECCEMGNKPPSGELVVRHDKPFLGAEQQPQHDMLQQFPRVLKRSTSSAAIPALGPTTPVSQRPSARLLTIKRPHLNHCPNHC